MDLELDPSRAGSDPVRVQCDWLGAQVDQKTRIDIPYTAPLVGNIKQILTGLQGFDAMALELIQNADDAGAKGIGFDVRPDMLQVRNDAAFSHCGHLAGKCAWGATGGPGGRRKACDFHAISMVGSSNKYNDPENIGRFGIGFVSVYQITDAPVIRSAGYEMRLDPVRELNSLDRVELEPGSVLDLRWAFDAESELRTEINASPLRSDDLKQVYGDLLKVARTCLLFLKSVERIEVMWHGRTEMRVVRSRPQPNRVRLSFEFDQVTEDWLLIEADAAETAGELRQKYLQLERLDRKTHIQIAVPMALPTSFTGKLFAYLPTEQNAPIPAHINADFFPEGDRKALVLAGHQHQRHWNQMLLDAAAATVAERIVELRDVLGPQGVWGIVGAAYEHKASEHFSRFWDALEDNVAHEEIVWTADELWVAPGTARIPPRETAPAEEQALIGIGVALVHETLRRNSNALQALGSRQIAFDAVVSAYEAWQSKHTDDDTQADPALMTAIVDPISGLLNRLVPGDLAKTLGGQALGKRLDELRLIPEADGSLSTVKGVYRTPAGVKNAQVSAMISDVPLVEEGFDRYRKLYERIDELTLDSLLVEIAYRVGQTGAECVVGADRTAVRRFFKALADYPSAGPINLSNVADVPFLPGTGRFLTPRQATLPGGFRDPLGKFDTIDTDRLDERSREFVHLKLGVRELTLETYVSQHLTELFKAGITRKDHAALVMELSRHREVTRDPVCSAMLKLLPLVLTQSNNLARPSECYFRTSELVEVLGDVPLLWADLSEIADQDKGYVQALLADLGVRHEPSVRHVVDRIVKLSEGPCDQATRPRMTAALAQIVTFFNVGELSEKRLEHKNDLIRLRQTKWLPASQSGKVHDKWYAPGEIFQPFRASGFDTQVPVLMRMGSKVRIDGNFLSFLGMREAPATSVVVAHLRHCVSEGIPPSDTTYAILNERAPKETDTSVFDPLLDTACVFMGEPGRFVHPTRVFWNKPAIQSRYCSKAPSSMQAHRQFFTLVGVRDEMSYATYASILGEMAASYGGIGAVVPIEDRLVHGLCFRALSAGLDADRDQVDEALATIEGEPFMLTAAGTLARVDDVVTIDSPWLVGPFEGDLDQWLVHPTPETRRLLEALGCQVLSAVTTIEPIDLGTTIPDEAAGDLVRDRAPTIIWLLSKANKEVRIRAYDALRRISVHHAEEIRVRSVFKVGEHAVRSKPRSERVFFHDSEGCLFVHADLREAYWIPAFRAILSTVLAGETDIDIPQCALNANLIVTAASVEDAQVSLEQAGFIAMSSAEHEAPIEEDRDEERDRTDVDDPAGDAEWIDEPYPEEPARQEASPGTDARPRGGDRAASEGGSRRAGSGATAGNGAGGGPGAQPNAKPSGDRAMPPAQTMANRAQTEWLRSYVRPDGAGSTDRGDGNGVSQERINAIDEAAMAAALAHEQAAGRQAERQLHLNPGFDILSRVPGGSGTRYIEVKGIDGAWTGRGVKLSRRQIECAAEKGDAFWLYVVEHAQDPTKRVLHAIRDPFHRASEFMFDEEWRQISAERADVWSLFTAGKGIHVDNFGNGMIRERQTVAEKHYLTIDFPVHGRKQLAFAAGSMRLLDG